MLRVHLLLTLLFLSSTTLPVRAADGPPSGAAEQKVGRLPHLEFDANRKQVRVECEMLAVNAPLEFFCCVKGSNDYEAMIRSEVKPSNLHMALLAIGLKPGQPLTYSESLKKWSPPQGPPLQIIMEYQKDGETVHEPAWKWMRDVHSKKPARPFTWVFTGSRMTPDGKYAADLTGYLISIVNFDLTVIDVPELASSSNDLLEWERNPDVTPKAGTKVWMVIEPAGRAPDARDRKPGPGRKADAPATAPTSGVDSDIRRAQQRTQELLEYWRKQVTPHRDALREAAEAHYKVVQELREQQQKLIDAADRLGRTIDQLEKEYQDLTTPRPQSEPGTR